MRVEVLINQASSRFLILDALFPVEPPLFEIPSPPFENPRGICSVVVRRIHPGAGPQEGKHNPWELFWWKATRESYCKDDLSQQRGIKGLGGAHTLTHSDRYIRIGPKFEE